MARSIDRQAGFALRRLGDFEEARRCLTRAIGWRERPGARIVAGQFVAPPRRTALGLLAGLPWIEGRPDQAIGMARQHLAALRECGFRLHGFQSLATLAEGLSRNGDPEGARSTAEEAAALLDGTDQRSFRPEMLRLRGNLLRLAGGEALQIARHYTQAIEAARAQGALAYELRAAIELAELGRETGMVEEGLQSLSSAYGRFREGFATRDLRRARSILG